MIELIRTFNSEVKSIKSKYEIFKHDEN